MQKTAFCFGNFLVVSSDRPAGGRSLTKTLLVMKLTILFLTAALFSAHAEGTAQKVTISGRDIPLEKITTVIKQQTGYVVLANKLDLANAKSITLSVFDLPLTDLLDAVLKDQPLKYSIKGKTIFLSRKSSEDSIRLVSSGPLARPVTGVIRDSEGNPLAGASISVKGTRRSVVSDAKGSYTIDVNEGDVLVFSFIGLKRQEVLADNRTVIDIVLEEDVAALNEVVINGGYYTTSGKYKIGSIAKVTDKDIGDQPVTTPLLALQGRVAGVDISPNSGIPGSGPNMEIRGRNSLRLDGDYPLYVIDGVPIDASPIVSASGVVIGGYDPLSSINPSNISSIEFLKDADATAIYGSRGANGVVLISTKKGGSGKMKTDLSAYAGSGKMERRLIFLNTPEYLSMRREAFRNNGNQSMNEFSAPDFLVWDTTRYTDWQDELLGGTANIFDAQGNISGGNSNTSFRFGGGVHKETMVFFGDFGSKRVTGNFSLNHSSADKKFSATLSAAYGAVTNNFFENTSVLSDAFRLPPNAPSLYNADGSLNWAPNSFGSGSWTNPVARYRNTTDSKTNNLVFNNVLSYRILPGVLLKTNFGYTSIKSSEIIKFPVSAIDPAIAQYYSPSSTFSTTDRSSWIIEPQVSFNKRINLHGFDVIVGTTWQEGNSNYARIIATGFASDALLGSLRGASNVRIVNDDNNDYRYTALFARIGYDWNEKYFLSLNARRDGSSRFGSDNRFGDFGSVGLSWIFSNENWMEENIHVLDFGKLRSSIGTTGNDQIGDYRYLNTYNTTLSKYYGLVGLIPTSLYNPDYKWEINKKFEVAIELSFFKRKLSLEVSHYRNRSSNQLMEYQLPGTTGFGSILMNLDAVVENKGWEFLTNISAIRTQHLTWDISLNFSAPRNRLVRYEDIEGSPYADTYVVGKPLSIRKLYQSTGVDPSTGVYTFKDVNSDGMIDATDRIVDKELSRNYFGGLNNTISYKNFQASFLFQFVDQMAQSYSPPDMPGFLANIPKDVYDNRWMKEGDIASVQKVSSGFGIFKPYTDNFYSDVHIEDASFVRLKTASISYAIPNSVLSRIKLGHCRIYIQGQNLFTVTGFKGIDPETGSNAVPPLRMFTAGVQIGI